MKKITRAKRVEKMKKFIKLTSVTSDFLEAKNIDRYDYLKVFKMLETELKKINLKDAPVRSIVKDRSNDFIDSEGVYYDKKGKTYMYKDMIIHDYNDDFYVMHAYKVLK